ncbi:hypothetical protein HanHA300_Chr03g0077771 [Helianthus annuus]|nr:hypothetical protein HanHA300_Chr03g0077771 [Helianthus annuus]KAJ0599139.1 hypothetical protein HanIR_Chr03g0101491 [Helianthus annuus]KAJ0772712.1 hypothetical protein HanOQP8_Chr03g0090541 [Helianthus annuus]KAJ0942225.1 hypothetical protein HanPSC8_Chr03g0089441 [Helianthus annuus]
MECQRLEEEEAARSALDMGKNIADEEVLQSSVQQEQKQPEAEVHVENVEVHAARIEVNIEEVQVNNEFALVPALLFTMVGEPKTVAYSREDNVKRIGVERRRLKAKKAKAAEIVDEKEEDEDEEDDDFKDIDDYHYDGDDDDDDHKDDDDNRGGNGGALIVRPPGADNVDDYLNDEQNEEHEDVQRQGESTSRSKQAAIQQGELVENWSRTDMLDALGLMDENLKFDIEDEIPEVPDEDYVFKFVEDADNFNDVVVEDDTSDSDNDVPLPYVGADDNFPTFDELLRTHNKDDLRRKVAEKITTEGPPKILREEEL